MGRAPEQEAIMAHISFHGVDRDAYEAIAVLELHGQRFVWKQLYVGEDRLLFYPGPWRDEVARDELELPPAARVVSDRAD